MKLNLNLVWPISIKLNFKLFDKFDITSGFKINSKSEYNSETKYENQLFHCYESGF